MPILDYLKRRLKEAGPRRWAAIAADTGCSAHTLRKVAYGDSENPGIAIVQRLLDWFQAVDDGKRKMPDQAPTPSASREAA